MSTRSPVRLIPKAEREPDTFVNGEPSEVPTMHGDGTVNNAWKRATFKSKMVIIEACAEGSDAVEAEYIIRRLLQTVAFLERKHGLKSGK